MIIQNWKIYYLNTIGTFIEDVKSGSCTKDKIENFKLAWKNYLIFFYDQLLWFEEVGNIEKFRRNDCQILSPKKFVEWPDFFLITRILRLN